MNDPGAVLQTLLEKDVAKERERVALEHQRQRVEELPSAAEVYEVVARERGRVRGLAGVPLDRDQARVELTEEERARRASRPRTRRWKQLDKLDQELDRLTQRQAHAGRKLQEAEQRLAEAPNVDAQTLAAWLADGEKGERPAATLYERQRDRDAAQIYLDACGVELDEKLETRLEFITKHRKRMLEDIRRDADKSVRNLRDAVNQLPGLRQELLDHREAILWLGSYPDLPETYGFPTSVALGLQEPVSQTLQTTARIEYEALIQLLFSDGEILASRFSADQRRKMGEDVDAELTPVDEAMWSSDERAVAWGKAEVELARRLAEYHPDTLAIAQEVRDLRPEP